MTPILSILVATRNRIPYCKNLIETILNFTDQDFELIIQDNSDSIELKNFCDKIVDTRFIYKYTPPPFSSIDNFNAVLSLASGTYLCLIGDDDSVNPDIFKMVRWANNKNIDSIVSLTKAIFWWPDTCETLVDYKGKNGVIKIYKITGEISSYSPKVQLKLLMNNGGQNYLNYKFPKLYHGIIKKEKLEAIKRKTGFYIGGLSPDIYAAVSLSFFVDKVFYIDYPLTIPGICSQSTSAEAANKKTVEKLEDAIHFRDRGHYDWSKLVPKFYSDENIWADTAIAALKNMGQEKVLSKFNIARLSVILCNKYKEKSKIILDSYFENLNISNNTLRKIGHKYLYFESKKMIFDNFIFRLTSIFRRKISNLSNSINPINEIEIINLQNVSEATDALTNYLSVQGFNIDKLIEQFENRL